MHPQAVTVARRPDEALLVGGLGFAVNRSDFAALIDVHQRAVQAVPAPVRRTLHDAQVHRQAVLRRQPAHSAEVAALYDHALIEVVGIHALLGRIVKSRAVREFDPERIARYQGFTEHDQLAAA